MAGAKGTKMPHGDKKQIMQYPVSDTIDEDSLKTLASVLNLMGANDRENARLTESRDALLPKLMAGEIDISAISTEELVV